MEQQTQCINCKEYGAGKFCGSCGQKLTPGRLSLGTIMHEAFHFFTHLDHGFPYTLKTLLKAPGKKQREYVDGVRAKHQKPFSMFFLCATFAALSIYWINRMLINYFDAGDDQEAAFFNKYWVVLQVVLLPAYAMITYLCFRRSRFNYGEVMVLQLYVFSFLFIFLVVVHLLKLALPHLETRYIELPFVLGYSVLTNLNFFTEKKKWATVALTVLSVIVAFSLAATAQDLLVSAFS